MCPLFAFSQEAGAAQGADSNTTQGISEEGSTTPRQEESELRFSDDGVPATQGEEIRPVTNFTIWDFLRMILVLGFVVALIYGLFFLLKRSQGAASRDSGVIEVVATQSLPGSGMVHLVKVGTQLFMLGSSEQSLRLLTEIDDKESRDEVELRAAQAATDERPTFSDLMGSMATSLGWGSGRRDDATGDSADAERGASVLGGPGADTPRAAGRTEVGGEAAAAAAGATEDGDGHTPDAGAEKESVTTAEARAEQEVLEYISSQRQRLRRLNS